MLIIASLDQDTLIEQSHKGEIVTVHLELIVGEAYNNS